MKRKVTLHGPATLSVSLPLKWARKYNVKKGDEVEVEESDDILKISSGKGTKEYKKVSIDFSKLTPSIIRPLISILHKAGYDDIEIFYKDSEQFRFIQERVNLMVMGCEIIEQSNKRCLIKHIEGEEEMDIGPILKRIFLVLLSFAKGTYEALKANNTKELNELLVLENTINKLTNYCERRIIKSRYQVGKDNFLYVIIWTLESMGDQLKDICNSFISYDKKIRINKEVLDIFQDIISFLGNYYGVFYKFSLEALVPVYEEYDRLANKIKELTKDKNYEETSLVIHLSNLTTLIHDSFPSMMGLNL